MSRPAQPRPRGITKGASARGPPPLPPANSYLTRSNRADKRKKTWRSAAAPPPSPADNTTGTAKPTPSYATFDNGNIQCRSEDPTLAWDYILSTSKVPCLQVHSVDPTTLLHSTSWNKQTHVRVVCISDTHGKHRKMTQTIPEGDILIHAGDFTNVGHTSQVKDVCEWLSNMPHPHKILISGNHDVTCDKEYYNSVGKNGTMSWKRWHHKGKNDDVAARAMLRETPGITYLEDAGCSIEGYRFYGSPWQPEFCDWAFNLDRGFPCKKMWDLIDTETEILITHGPPVGHGDNTSSGQRAGCVDLLSTVTERVQPLYHIFGHIHESYGVTSNGTTTFINASTCTHSYRPDNVPIVFDLPRKRKTADAGGVITSAGMNKEKRETAEAANTQTEETFHAGANKNMLHLIVLVLSLLAFYVGCWRTKEDTGATTHHVETTKHLPQHLIVLFLSLIALYFGCWRLL